MNTGDVIFVGIKRCVLAVEKSTGKIVWEARLSDATMGDTFVNLFLDAGCIYAQTKGALYCLDAATGRKRWENPLTGYGYGIATFASATAAGGNVAAAVHKIKADEARRAADGSPAASS